MDNNIYIKIIKAFGNDNGSFSYSDIESRIELSENEKRIIKDNMQNAFKNAIVINGSTPNLESIFNLVNNHNKSKEFGFNITSVDTKNQEFYPVIQSSAHTEVSSKVNKLDIYLEKELHISDKYILKPEMIFHYLDYIELTEARINAEKAQKSSKISLGTAIFAIFISIVTLLVSIYYSQRQLTYPVELNKFSIEEIKFDDSKLINSIQQNSALLQDTNQYLDDIDGKILKLYK